MSMLDAVVQSLQDAAWPWMLSCALYVAMALGTLCTVWSVHFAPLILQGRLRPKAIGQKADTGPLAAVMKLEIRKKAWTWFYLVGFLYNLVVFVALVLIPEHPIVQTVLRALLAIGPSTDFWGKVEGFVNGIMSNLLGAAHTGVGSYALLYVRLDVLMFLGLMVVQTGRRFLECLLVTEFGESKMHVAIFVVGVAHYVLVPTTVLTERSTVSTSQEAFEDLSPVTLGCMSVGVLLFLIGSYHQWHCNLLIAQQKRANKMRPIIPVGDWFGLVRSPLYTSELLIYLSFVVLTHGSVIMLYIIFAWVTVNQAVLARLSSLWYEQKFRERRDKLAPYVLVPGIW